MSNIFKKIISSTCLSYTISSFILNFIVWISSHSINQSRMLEIWANILILLVCFFCCTIIECRKNKKEAKPKFIVCFASISSVIYTFSTMVTNTVQYIIKQENFWNGYTLLILLLFSIIASFLILKIKIKSYLIASILNFFIIGIFYYIIFVVKAGFLKGNLLLISTSIYFIVYMASAVIYYLITKNNRKKQNSKKDYKSLFS